MSQPLQFDSSRRRQPRLPCSLCAQQAALLRRLPAPVLAPAATAGMVKAKAPSAMAAAAPSFTLQTSHAAGAQLLAAACATIAGASICSFFQSMPRRARGCGRNVFPRLRARSCWRGASWPTESNQQAGGACSAAVVALLHCRCGGAAKQQSVSRVGRDCVVSWS